MGPAAKVCRSCGTGLREGAKFCDECGAPTAVSVDSAEYKQVTVLFADVVRSMDIAAAVDIERFREIMTELVQRSAAVVQRYGGGTVEYTGDGVMALFGAPVALEDHAFRACLAALAIHEEGNRLAAEVARRDGLALQLRVGLNSGRVIAGEIGAGAMGYAATGETVGFAQRMESVAPPGGVMLSESTARLVEHTVMLAEPEWVRIKGADEPVRARRLVGIGPRDGRVGRAEAGLVGRGWEMAALDAMVDRTIGGRGGVVNVVGPPGIGKSRAAREAAALAAGRGFEVFWAFCESHAGDIPFHVVAQLLRAGSGVADLDGDAARARLRAGVPTDADPQDLLLLHDLLGIADPDVALPQIDPDARRRRLTALINTAWLARTQAALFIIEDAHWIDAVSESMLAGFLSVVPRTPSMVLITARPEYEGALTRAHGAQTIALVPLGDSDTATLLGELLGSDHSVAELAAIIADRAAGNPFFAEEMVRELVQRGVLQGERGGYVCRTDVADIAVPATVQAAIEARIDRLSTPAKRTLNAASVIGARFEAGLLAALGIDPVVDELLCAELIDQVRFTPAAGDPARGAGFCIGSPLAIGLAFRGVARWWLGRPGWRQDLHDAVAMARNSDPTTHALVVAWTYGVEIVYGVLRADDSAVRASEEAVQTAQRASSDSALMFSENLLGIALLNREAATDRDRGLEIAMHALGILPERIPSLVPVFELWVAQERVMRGDCDAAIVVMRQAVDELHQAGRLGYWVWGTGVLAEALLKRGAQGDLAEAQEAIDRLANLPDDDSAVRKITLLRLRALLSRARSDDVAYRDFVSRYRAMAESLGFEGHIAWAEAMPDMI